MITRSLNLIAFDSFHNIFLGGKAAFIFLIALKDILYVVFVFICIIYNYILFFFAAKILKQMPQVLRHVTKNYMPAT